MPAMANITVLNGAGSNVVYNAATPSAGDKVPAVWRANALSTRMGWRPSFTVLTRDNGNRNGRHFTATYKFPIIETNGAGDDVLVATVPFTVEGTLPTNADSTVVTDAFIQLGNLLVSTLVRASAAEGYAPT